MNWQSLAAQREKEVSGTKLQEANADQPERSETNRILRMEALDGFLSSVLQEETVVRIETSAKRQRHVLKNQRIRGGGHTK